MKIRVFIADDHGVVRDGLRALLEPNPLVTVVGDSAGSEEAIGQVLKLDPDVILLDISMPGLNGLDAAQQILGNSPHKKVIILSMFGTPEYVYRALKAGARGYLLKESAGREVVDAVLAVHDGRFYFSQPVMDTILSDYLQQHEQAEKKDPLMLLSEREREILPLVVEGKTSAEIAELLFLSPKTIETYRSRMMQKLDTPDLPSLIKYAIQHGIAS